MEDNLNLILNWFDTLGIKPNLEKLKRQLSVISSWFKHNSRGVFEAITGFGKTYVAIIAIYRLNLKYPDANTIVIVPTLKLYKDWLEHISNFNLKNVELFVVNTYTQRFIDSQIRYKCVLLVVDEIHNVLGENAIQFNQTIKCTDFDMFFGMTATLEEKERDSLLKMNIPIIDTITMSEGLRFNYVSNFKTFNFGIELSTEELANYTRVNDIHNSNYSKFYWFVESDKNWELARACGIGNDKNSKVGNEWRTGKEWRDWYADKMDWNGEKDHPWSPQNIAKYANQWNWAMRERKDYLHKHESKIHAAKLIINHLKVQTIVFCENTSFADELANQLGEKAMCYHSNLVAGYKKEPATLTRKNLSSIKKLAREYDGVITINSEGGYNLDYMKETKVSGAALKRIAISKFEIGEINTLVTAKALDEGFNVENIECALTCSGSSKKRQATQRNGRALRFIEGKTAFLINLYIKNTQDEVWLKKRQKGDPGILWVDNVNQIN